MEYRFSPEEEAFRQELVAFIKKELPPGWVGGMDDSSSEDWAIAQQMRQKLAARGWLTLAWPREYGGMGASFMQQVIFTEEMAYNRCPGKDVFGVRMLGPTLIIYGTEEQKRRHLGGIARGEVVWCQGFSEPGAGSDLASLSTRAVEDGDDFVVNGQKVWTSGAHHADWMFLLVRTDPNVPKHKGISYLLVDMKSPGVTVRPLVYMAGYHAFNEVYFDNVRVPRSHLVGEKNQGWYVAMATLNFERSGVEWSAMARHTHEEIVDYARAVRRNGRPLSKDPLVRAKLAESAIEIEVSKLLAYRIAWMQSQGRVPDAESSMAKAFGTELLQRLTLTGLQIMGLPSVMAAGSRWAPLQGRLQRHYLRSFGYTIEAGTSEVQRMLIATRGLGLPR
ncbi:MAG: acyl-CoA dehydrogenase family protein [Chloroflexi bacterium]|nr:acyl-CoA dehydrogenase family protein [Chloroflexota bacterium]